MVRRGAGEPAPAGSVVHARPDPAGPPPSELQLPRGRARGGVREARRDRHHGRAGGLHLGVGDGPLPPDPAGRPAAELDVRGQHDARRDRRTDQTIALGLLVGGVTYRNPAQHAKITTTLDIISGGRAFHGIGAGWFEAEHDAYGYAFPPLKERFERLEDHLRIARAMFTEEQATVAGDHHSVTGAYNNPKPLRGDIPILDRRQRRAQDAADGRPVRRRLQPVRRPRARPAPARRARAPLRERRARPGRDHQDVDDVGRDRRDRGRRARQARRDARRRDSPSSGSPARPPARPSRSSSTHRRSATSASRA